MVLISEPAKSGFVRYFILVNVVKQKQISLFFLFISPTDEFTLFPLTMLNLKFLHNLLDQTL